MNTGNISARAESDSWPTATPAVSVVVATHNRVPFLAGLFEALERQTASIEVVIADDGSNDLTWPWLQRYAATTALPVLALRLEQTGGPSVPRNTAARQARAPRLAVTDDDCLPEPGWAAAVTANIGRDAAIAQGRTVPTGDTHGPWDRAVAVERPSFLFETCNLGFDRERFLALDGFPTLSVLRHVPRGFGEDVVFGARIAREGGFTWAPDAVVRHRWIAGSYADHLRGVRRLSGFPWLAREVPEVAGLLVGGVFLSRRTAQSDAALLAVAAAAVGRRPWLLAGALPWARQTVAMARHRPGRPTAVRVAQLATADVVGLASLVGGSIRHRRLVL